MNPFAMPSIMAPLSHRLRRRFSAEAGAPFSWRRLLAGRIETRLDTSSGSESPRPAPLAASWTARLYTLPPLDRSLLVKTKGPQ
jgi:hypothetical protein